MGDRTYKADALHAGLKKLADRFTDFEIIIDKGDMDRGRRCAGFFHFVRAERGRRIETVVPELGALRRLSWILPVPVSEAMPVVERKSEEAPLMSNFKKLEPERLIFPAMVLLRVVPSAKLSVAELLAFRLAVLAERAPAPLKRSVPAVASTAPELVFVPLRVVVPRLPHDAPPVA
jgi:hypothetical protein